LCEGRLAENLNFCFKNLPKKKRQNSSNKKKIIKKYFSEQILLKVLSLEAQVLFQPKFQIDLNNE
jgi:hypothetical protein